MKQNTDAPLTKEFLKDELHEFRNEIMDKLDFIVSELETAREDRTLATYQFSALQETVTDHETRISTLEHPQTS